MVVRPAQSVSAEALLELRDASISFGEHRVLDRVSFAVEAGAVHVLCGENGAGKSTLIKILCGIHTDFAGELRVRGARAAFRSPADARRAGVAVIHQELSLIGPMSIADNLFLGREIIRKGMVDRSQERRIAARLLSEVGLDLDPDIEVGALPISVQQRLEIARALAFDADVIIMDEPTSALHEQEAELLFGSTKKLCEKGKGIVYISHRMQEIYAIADQITVLRDGKSIGTALPSELPEPRLVQWMIGRDAPLRASAPSSALDPIRLEVRRFGGGELSFRVRQGEILGVAGLRGSGNTELLHSLFGSLGPVHQGEVTLDGEPFLIDSPLRSIERGVVLLTSDRKATGLFPDLSVIENATLSSLDRVSPRGWVHKDEERRRVTALVPRLRLAAPSLDAPVGVLSGGGQQKVVLARCLLAAPRVLLLDEPTRGVDIVAKADIYALLRETAALGVSILLITSEMEELLALSDRILVMHRGRKTAELDRAEASPERVLRAALGQEA
jgi:ABC-type sugar transport system ATPase subunit